MWEWWEEKMLLIFQNLGHFSQAQGPCYFGNRTTRPGGPFAMIYFHVGVTCWDTEVSERPLLFICH